MSVAMYLNFVSAMDENEDPGSMALIVSSNLPFFRRFEGETKDCFVSRVTAIGTQLDAISALPEDVAEVAFKQLTAEVEAANKIADGSSDPEIEARYG